MISKKYEDENFYCDYQNQDLVKQTTYKQLISNSQNLTVIPISRQVLIEAAQLRANFSIKLPDAIHAATALLT